MRVAVVGGGIAGLTAAWALHARHDVVLFEREAIAGGKIRSQAIDGFLFEWGPAGFLSSAAELVALIAEIGLAGEVRAADPAAKKRAIYWGGRLHALPLAPPGMLRLALLSPLGKLRAFAELIAGRALAPGPAADAESVASFVARHFGREVAERIVAPVVLGVSGGDAAQTSVAALFPRLLALERAHGSVIRGMLRGGARPGRLSGFGAPGMQRLTGRLAELLGPRVRLGAAVTAVEPRAGGWRVVHDGEPHEVDAVILATPAPQAAALVAPFATELASELRRIPYAAMRAVGIAFRAADLPQPLDGFGFLAARGHGLRILGAVSTSAIFPEQAPPGTAYLRVFLGGAGDPDVLALDAGAVERIVRADLANALGVRAAPVAYHEVVWPQAIPQYTLAHPAIVARCDALTALHPGLLLAGNAYRGLGIGDNVRDALAVAARLDGR